MSPETLASGLLAAARLARSGASGDDVAAVLESLARLAVVTVEPERVGARMQRQFRVVMGGRP